MSLDALARRLPAAVALVAGLLFSACAEPEETVAPYDRVGVPAVPDRTRPVVDAPLPDGDYWATSITSANDGKTLTVRIAQVLFDPTCTAELGAEACADGSALIDTPAKELLVDPADLRIVSVVAADRRNFSITGAELLALVSGAGPSADAPDDYAYEPYPFLVSLRDGGVVEARQIWLDQVTD